ncbi:LOW QUALITY PROTEIN: hypothetical protein M8C21_021659 [Ambrosia artemisiifolia]|uniref:Glycosyltransferase n=1 Tax=Ambrosia artemisiifolia TaxID=4212 RepID=A0AAD5GAP8_AMBAR|nr:LOW QUALITY PROTEIN: hypothetical protein M8C21_021659 [Ambrosia artemisiifolia]
MSPTPHALIFPIPMQGPVNCMLKLAELLCISNISVTFLNTEHIHRTLLRHSNVLTRFSRYDNFRFETISDGLPDDHPRSVERFLDLFDGMRSVTEPVFREMMVSGCFSMKSECPVTVIIPDASFAFVFDVAEEVGIPVVYFETVSPCALWTYLCLPKLIEAGEVPFKDVKTTPITDGLPDDHPHCGDRILEECECPVTVIEPDGVFSFVVDVAEEVGIPVVYLILPCALWTYFCLPKLIDAGEVPFKDNDLDVLIKNVPGTENFLRRRDLPSFYRLEDLANPVTEIIMMEARCVPRAHGLILNTFQALDEMVLVHMRTLCPNIYCIGPIHTLYNSRVTSEPKVTTQRPQSNVSNSLWEENVDCLSWLDTQVTRSVVYVSIGSMAMMTVDQFFEFWHGLVNSGKPFLWVQRPGSIIGEYDDNQVPKHLADVTKQRGFITTWVPQEAVLAHSAIGGFLTHSGWNSTIESIMEGVPMICWPQNVDQQVNSRFVNEVWKIGIDIKDTCDRAIVKKAVRDVIDVRRSEFIGSTRMLGELGGQSVAEDGASVMDLNRLIKTISSL